MTTRRTLLSALLLFGAISIWALRSEAEGDTIVVIVNKANPSSSLGESELRPIFQTTRTSWPDGADVTPFNLLEDNELRHAFDQAVLGLDPERVARYWQDRKIRGGARPPKRLPNTSAVLAAVAANPGAVGYVMAAEANHSVKVVAKIVHGKLGAP